MTISYIRRAGGVILLLLAAIGMAACSGSDDMDDDVKGVMMWRIGMSDQGFVQVVNDTVWYYDMESGEQAALLCQNKARCSDNPYYKYDADGYDIPATLMYEDNLYIFVKVNVNETALYRLKPDVDGRETVALIDWDMTGANRAIVHRGKVYMEGIRYIVNEDGTAGSDNKFVAMLSVDLKSGEVKEWGERYSDPGSGLDAISVVGDRLRYRHSYYIINDEYREALASGQLTMELAQQLLRASVQEVNLTTGESTSPIAMSDYPGYCFAIDDKYAYFLHERKTGVYRVELSSLQRTELFEGREITIGANALIPGAGIFFSQGVFDGKIYFYDFKAEEVITVPLPEWASSPIASYKDWLAYGATVNKENGENGEYMFVFSKLEDYLKGNGPYISVK